MNKFFEECRDCKGEGTKFDAPEIFAALPMHLKLDRIAVMDAICCENCLGKGYIPTEDGRQLLQFLRLFINIQ